MQKSSWTHTGPVCLATEAAAESRTASTGGCRKARTELSGRDSRSWPPARAPWWATRAPGDADDAAGRPSRARSGKHTHQQHSGWSGRSAILCFCSDRSWLSFIGPLLSLFQLAMNTTADDSSSCVRAAAVVILSGFARWRQIFHVRHDFWSTMYTLRQTFGNRPQILCVHLIDWPLEWCFSLSLSLSLSLLLFC
jgi:hypothetical protein